MMKESTISLMLLLLSYGATTCRGNTANLFDACKRQTRELDNDLELQGLYLNALIPSTALKYFMGPTVETDNQEYRPHFGTVDWASASLESFETACTKKGGVYRELDVFLDCVDYDGDYKTNPLVGDLRLEQNNAPYCFGVTCDDEHMRRLVEQDQEWTDPILPFKIENPQNPSTPCKGRVFTGEISNQGAAPTRTSISRQRYTMISTTKTLATKSRLWTRMGSSVKVFKTRPT